MNRRNNWKAMLELSNNNLKRYNVSLKITPEDNTFSLDIIFPDRIKNYACGYYEDELEDLIVEARSWAKSVIKIK